MAYDPVKIWLNINGRLPVLPESEVLRLATVVHNEESSEQHKARAVNKLVKHNLKLVAKITIGFLSQKNIYSTQDDRVSDYLQQGTLGLIKAAQKFDPTRGYKFSTYAHNWIKSYLRRYYYTNYSMVHIPENVLCAMIANNKPELAKSVALASRFSYVDSLDRVIETSKLEQVCLGDIIDEHGLVLV